MRFAAFALAAIALTAPLPAASQSDDPDAPLPARASLPVRALVFPVRALVFPASSFVSPVNAMVGPPTRDLVLPRRDLVFAILDLVAAPRAIEIKESKTEIRLELAADVLFDFDKADLKPAAQDVLKQVATFVRENAKGAVRIEGHTDAKGADAYNQKLSERRAASVKDWLAKNAGAKGVTYQTQGFGAKRPVAPNAKPDGADDPAGRQKNRRVELVIKR